MSDKIRVNRQVSYELANGQSSGRAVVPWRTLNLTSFRRCLRRPRSLAGSALSTFSLPHTRLTFPRTLPR